MPLERLSLREMQQRPVRTLLTLLSIIIGSGAILATAVSSRSAKQAQTAMVEAVTGKASLEISAAAGTPLEIKSLKFLKELPNIEVISPMIRRFAMMTVQSQGDGDGKAPASRKFRVQLLGVNPVQDRLVRGTRVVSGADFSAPNESPTEGQPTPVWTDATFAKSAELAIGDEIKLLTRSGRQTARIVGIVETKEASSAIQSAVIVVPLAVAQIWNRAQGSVDVVQLVVPKDKRWFLDHHAHH